MFLDEAGQPLPFSEASVGGGGVATPGVLRMLEMAPRDHGRLPWSRLFEPAMRLAESGFTITPRLHKLIEDNPQLREMPGAAAYFYDKSLEPRAVGQRLENPQLFETLRLIANGGADAFCRGQLARDIVAAATDPKQQGASARAGRLTLADLALYRAIKRDPVCGIYRGLKVCGMGPPSSGGIAVAQILGILDHFTLRDLSPDSLEAVHRISEADRPALADGPRYVADSDFVHVPVRPLLSSHYLQQRAGLISLTRTMGRAEAGRIGEQSRLTRPAGAHLNQGPPPHPPTPVPPPRHPAALSP